MVGVPVIINHKDLNKENADDERVGVVNSVWYDEKDGWYWCDGIIWDETAQNLITDKNWSVSCSYDVKTANDEGGSENNIKYDMEFLDGVFTHLALVDNPRYERANIVFNSKTVIENNNFNPNQKRNERGQWVKDNALIQQKKDSLNPIQIDASDIPQFESKEELGNWFRKIFEDLGSVTITDTGIKIDLYGGNADRESFKRRFQQKPNKAVAKAFEEIVTTSIKVDEREKDENHKHDQEIYYNKLKLGQDNFDVNLFVDYLAPNKEYRYAGHSTVKIDNKISTRDTQVINHIMLTKVDNNIINDVESDFNPNVKENEEMNVENGFITLDGGTEKERVIWIPENVHWVSPKARNRVNEIITNFEKNGGETKYDFSHTRVKPTEEQIKYLKDSVAELENDYDFKKVAQIEISSELNSGSWGVCFSPENTSIISVAPSMYKENAQEKYDASVKSGFHPKDTGEAIKSVLVHEMGHAITVNSGKKEFWNAIDKIRSDYLKNIKKNDIENPDFISNYARTNKYEFVAEAFCQGRLSEKYGKYTKQVMEEISKHFSHGSKSKVSNAKEEVEMWIEEFGFGYPIDEEAYEEMKKSEEKERKKDVKNSKEQDMALIEELKKLITKVENEKGDDMADDKEKNEVENENVDKRKLIDEVGGILKGKVDDEVIRTIIGKLEKVAYDKSEAGTADNEKEEDDKKDDAENCKKVKNEDDEKDEKEVKEVKEDVKEDVENKCKNSVDNSKTDYFKRLNEIYNSASQAKETTDYVSRADREKAAEDYFAK